MSNGRSIKKNQNDREKKMKLDDLVCKFNIITMGIMNHVVQYYNNIFIGNVKIVLENIIIKQPDELISGFLLHVYKNDEYRKNILEQNDNFFMQEDLEKVADGDQEKIVEMFKFKNLWQQFDDDTKVFIKKSMATLVMISQHYILAL
jgi:hypothetical protein